MDYKKPQSTLVQGGAGIYPLTTADQVILADGSRLEKDGRISADSAANSAKLGGKAPEYYIQPRNLLDNSNFRNPVNQRGIAYGGTLNSGYTIDRWYYQQSAGAGDGYFGLTEYYVSLKAPSDGYSQMYQNLERYSAMKGKTYTFATSIRYGNNAESVKAVTFTMGAIDTGLILTEDGNVKLYSVDGMNVLIRVTGQNEYAFTWAALYEGSYTADTLPPYVPKGYAAELAECQRYYYQSWTDGSANTFNGVIIREAIALSRTTNVVFPQTMRISNPTVTLYSPSTGNTGKASEFVSDTEIDVGSVYLSRNGFALSSTASAFEIGKHYCIHYSVSADL